MLNALRHLFRARQERTSPAASVPPGERVYAVGDIHGRLDLFEALIRAIEADDADRDGARTTVILLGDLIDRGPDSAGVIRTARAWGEQRTVRYIAGNHEEMLLQGLEKPEVLRVFMRHGGRETVLSYPVDPAAYAEADWDALRDLIAAAIPPADLTFLRGFENTIRIGDYAFVHAGVLPGVPLEAQRTSDLRWIREPFLSHAANHGYVVVHGHTITDEVEHKPNRIGIDTGAYASGRLTALGLEGTERWLIEAREEGGTISSQIRIIA